MRCGPGRISSRFLNTMLNTQSTIALILSLFLSTTAMPPRDPYNVSKFFTCVFIHLLPSPQSTDRTQEVVGQSVSLIMTFYN